MTKPNLARYIAEQCAREIGSDFRREITAIVEGRVKSEVDGSIITLDEIIQEGRNFVNSAMEDAIELAILRYTEEWKAFEIENGKRDSHD